MDCASMWWLMNPATKPALQRPASALSIVQGDLVKYHTTHSNIAAPKPNAAGHHRQACVETLTSATQSRNFGKRCILHVYQLVHAALRECRHLSLKEGAPLASERRSFAILG